MLTSRRDLLVCAEDDPDDRVLLEQAVRTEWPTVHLCFVDDGDDLLDCLRGEGRWRDHGPTWPALLLLDLNMPRRGGRETLAELKGDSRLCRLPVVVLSTGVDPVEVNRAYAAGAASYVAKPSTYEELLQFVRALRAWWMGVVTLPDPC